MPAAHPVTASPVTRRRRFAGVVVTIAGLVAIAVATLTPTRGVPWPSSPWCLTCSWLVTADAVVNVLLFVPAGVGLGLLARRTLPAVLGLALLSSAIEVAQAWVIPGRAPALRDVITNSLGGAIGVLLAGHAHVWLRPRVRVARWLAIGGALGWTATLGMTAALLRPSTPPGPYYGQRGGVGEFGSRVVHVAVNGIPIPLGPLENPEQVLAALNARDVDVEVAVSPGVIPWNIGPIARVAHFGDEAFRLAQNRGVLTFSLRLRAGDARLRSPIVRLRHPDGAPAWSADTLRFRAGVRDGVLHVSYDDHAAVPGVFPLVPTAGWALLTPPPVALRFPVWLLNALWVAMLCFPIGYWTEWAGDDGQRSARAGARKGTVALRLGIVAIVIGSLAVVPMTLATPSPPWTDWCAAILALIGGALTARAVRRLGTASRHAATGGGVRQRQ